MKQQRIIGYDLVKIFACFLVCLYHLAGGQVDVFQENTFYFPNFNQLCMNLCAMCVPLFFMVNGSLTLSKEYSYKKIITKSGKLLLICYFWFFVLIKIPAFLLYFDQEFTLTGFFLYITNTNGGFGHLWFLRTLCLLTLFSPIMKKIYENKLLLSISLGILLLIPFLYNYMVALGVFFHIPPLNTMNRTGLFTSYSLVYYWVGKLLYDFIIRTKPTIFKTGMSIVGIIAGWLLVTGEVILWTNINHTIYDGGNGSFPTIGALLMSLGTFYLFSILSVKQTFEKFIYYISNTTIGIYIFHWPIISLLRKSMPLNMNSLWSILLWCLLVMICSAIITLILKKIPGIRAFLKL